MRAIGLLLAAMLTLSSVAPAKAAETYVLLRSDLPLPLKRGQDFWPRHYEGHDGFGNASAFATGDWKSVPSGCDEIKDPDCPSWSRLAITSAFHRYFDYGEGATRDDLPRVGHGKGTIIIDLDPKQGLYALQVGFMGGSEYDLILAPPSHGLIKKYAILAARCLPQRGVTYRKAHHPDIFATDYCAVNSMTALVRIGRDARTRPPLATVTWVGDTPETPEK